MNKQNNHTFIICAYKESPFLEKCVESLLNQTQKSQVIIITSTPNILIKKITEKYNIECIVNTGEKGIVQDWNFAYKIAKTKYVTLAHQDDIYSNDYVEKIISEMNRAKYPLIAFTDYYEIRNNRIIKESTMLRIKRIMLLPLKIRLFQRSRLVRRVILSFGCPICCPSVTFNKENLPEKVFQVGYRSNEDWQAWEKMSRLKGEFIYCSNSIMYHRIHKDSETTAIIGDNVRRKEDYDMFCKFWPKFIARILTQLYCKSEISNNLDMDIKKSR